MDRIYLIEEGWVKVTMTQKKSIQQNIPNKNPSPGSSKQQAFLSATKFGDVVMKAKREIKKEMMDQYKRLEVGVLGQGKMFGLEAVSLYLDHLEVFYSVECISNQAKVYTLDAKIFQQELEK